MNATKSLVGRTVVGIDGPGQSIESPARRGEIATMGESRWGASVRIDWEDGESESCQVRSLQEGAENGIGLYLLPEPTPPGIRPISADEMVHAVRTVGPALRALEAEGDKFIALTVGSSEDVRDQAVVMVTFEDGAQRRFGVCFETGGIFWTEKRASAEKSWHASGRRFRGEV